MSWRWVFALLATASATFGCSRTTPAQRERVAPVAAPSASVTPPNAADAGDDAAEVPDAASDPEAGADGNVTVVVLRDAHGRLESHFLVPNAAAVTRPGVFVALGPKLYRWKTEIRHAPAEKCPAGNPNPYTRYDLEKVTLVEVGSHAALDPFPRSPGDAGAESDDVAKDSYVLLAVLGRFLFVREDFSYWPCGMHPQYGVEFHAFEIRDSGEVQKVDPRVLYAGAEARRGEALGQLNAHASNDDSMDSAVTIDEVKPTLAFPTFGAGGLGWTVQYTTRATWAGSSGDWAGYTRSVKLPLRVVPRKFRSFASLVARIGAFRPPHPSDEVLGVSSGTHGPP